MQNWRENEVCLQKRFVLEKHLTQPTADLWQTKLLEKSDSQGTQKMAHCKYFFQYLV